MNYLLIGQPNVGKSSIFNILTKSNSNIVHKDSGTTRDWHSQLIKETTSYLFDTPGILIDDKNNKNIFNSISQINLFNKIDKFFYVVDYNQGFTDLDNYSISRLRKLNKEIYLIINKFDNFKILPNDEFRKYGLKNFFYVSCSHNHGFKTLHTKIKNILNQVDMEPLKEDFSVAIFGKPNAGKSTFLNSIVGYDRSKTSSIAGTTSDYVIEIFNYNNKYIKFIDTAGIGKKANVKNNSINYLAIKKSFDNIRIVDTSVIIIDSLEGIDRQDKRIIKLVSTKSKSVILIFNKMDLIEDKKIFKDEIISSMTVDLSEVKNIKIFFISALNKKNSLKVLDYLINFKFSVNYNFSTSKLNSWLKNVTSNYQHPLVDSKKVNFKYIVQVNNEPVIVKIFCNYSSKIKNNYKRYLINNFNNNFKIKNQRTKIIFSSSINPYI